MPEIYKAKKKKKRRVRQVTVADRLSKERKPGKLGAFNVLPGKVKFETQDAKEKVLLLLRQHMITQVKWIGLAVVMVFMPISLIWIPLLEFMPGNYQFMAIVIWYLLTVALVYEKFISWYFHVFIITDERVIDVDFYNLLHKEVSQAKIDNIEDVTYTHVGVMSAWFNYGDVSLQTAAESQEFTIKSVPEPSRVVKILNELKLEEEQEKIEGRVR